MNWELISLPIVAAVIGWGTNVIAIRMLFWPREPIRFFGFELLGVLPKRKQDIARSIGEVLNDDLLPTEELIAAVNSEETRTRVARLITDNLTAKIQRFLPRFIMEHAEGKIRPLLEDLVSSEMENLFTQLSEDFSQELKEQRFLAKLVEDKINSFDLVHLEQLVLKVARNELRYIELFGAVIGFVIGLVQILLVRLF
ncbi:MAG: DUF445 domain-containing protein [Limnochordia bacterium]|jgi:uncharacterized membrane protein YheB (UPF0754 family)|nr:DUF445 family protein [Bacillota bacterium]